MNIVHRYMYWISMCLRVSQRHQSRNCEDVNIYFYIGSLITFCTHQLQPSDDSKFWKPWEFYSLKQLLLASSVILCFMSLDRTFQNVHCGHIWRPIYACMRSKRRSIAKKYLLLVLIFFELPVAWQWLAEWGQFDCFAAIFVCCLAVHLPVNVQRNWVHWTRILYQQVAKANWAARVSQQISRKGVFEVFGIVSCYYWLIDWLIEWMNEWMNEWLIDWLIDWLPYGTSAQRGY